MCLGSQRVGRGASILTVLLVGAFLFAAFIAASPALHEAWHGHQHDRAQGSDCLASSLARGAAEQAFAPPPLVSASMGPPTRLPAPDRSRAPLGELPTYVLEHAPPSAS